MPFESTESHFIDAHPFFKSNLWPGSITALCARRLRLGTWSRHKGWRPFPWRDSRWRQMSNASCGRWSLWAHLACRYSRGICACPRGAGRRSTSTTARCPRAADRDDQSGRERQGRPRSGRGGPPAGRVHTRAGQGDQRGRDDQGAPDHQPAVGPRHGGRGRPEHDEAGPAASEGRGNPRRRARAVPPGRDGHEPSR